MKEYEGRIASLESEIERLSAEVGAERARTEEALRARNDANLELERVCTISAPLVSLVKIKTYIQFITGTGTACSSTATF